MREENNSVIQQEPTGSLLLTYIKGSASIEEKQVVDKWLKENNSHEKELLQIAQIYHAQQMQARILSRDPISAYEKVQTRIKWKKRRITLMKITAVAASIIGVIALSSLFTLLNKTEYIHTEFITVKANIGMRTSVDLPDGTIVYLNSGSSLTYPIPYNKKERHVTLEGEAFFDVAHNKEIPFIVSVLDEKFNVRVLGTKFNLQAYKNDQSIETTLVSGLVSLEMINKQGAIYEQLLSPSEKAIYSIEDKEIVVEKVNSLIETSWINGKIMFKDTPLPQVLKRLSHFYNVTFDIKDPVLEEYHFTGSFIDKQLSQILDYLKISSNIDYQINQTKEDDSHGQKHTTVILWKKK